MVTNLMTGSYAETSERSGVTYWFRRLRPTLALSYRGTRLRCLAALCTHPLGTYEGSWAGVLVPTDELCSHLLLMRGRALLLAGV